MNVRLSGKAHCRKSLAINGCRSLSLLTWNQIEFFKAARELLKFAETANGGPKQMALPSEKMFRGHLYGIALHMFNY